VEEIHYGIGLSMMKKRVEELRGTMHVESEKGRGFAIEIRLPLSQQETGLKNSFEQ
jgi:signal transduction histidine kinase